MGASGHQKQSQVVKFCCSFLWVSEFAEVQPCCCIFCASAVNQVIQLFAGYGQKCLLKLVLLVKPEILKLSHIKLSANSLEHLC